MGGTGMTQSHRLLTGLTTLTKRSEQTTNTVLLQALFSASHIKYAGSRGSFSLLFSKANFWNTCS